MASMIEYLMYSAQNIVGMFLLYVPWMLIPFSICIILYDITSVQHSYFCTARGNPCVFIVTAQDSSPHVLDKSALYGGSQGVLCCGHGSLRLPCPQHKKTRAAVECRAILPGGQVMRARAARNQAPE